VCGIITTGTSLLLPWSYPATVSTTEYLGTTQHVVCLLCNSTAPTGSSTTPAAESTLQAKTCFMADKLQVAL